MMPTEFRVWNVMYNQYDKGEMLDPSSRMEFCVNTIGQIYTIRFVRGATLVDEVSDRKYVIEWWTGLFDRNGRKIYVGDIVKVNDDYDSYGIEAGEVHEVYFADGGFRCKPKRDYAIRRGDRGFWIDDGNDFEVIGDIHNNRELLGGKNEK